MSIYEKVRRKINFLNWVTCSIPLVALAIIIGWITTYGIWLPQTHRTVTATITKTWVNCRWTGKEAECKNLIGTTAGVFQDTDSLMYWKFNSSDYFSTMLSGHTYTFSVVGWRIPFLSEYPNIVSCEDC